MKSPRNLLATALAALLCLLASGSATARDFPGDEILEVDLARTQLELSRARRDAGFWANWRKTDAAIVRLFHKDPSFASSVLFQDPEVTVDAWPMLLAALLDNVRRLDALGRHGDARRVNAKAAQLAAFADADAQVWAGLLLNTLSRFLLAGWRDVEDPISTLEFQVDQVLLNAHNLRGHIKGKQSLDRTPKWAGLLFAALLTPLPPWTAHRVAGSLSPVNPLPSILGHPGPVPAVGVAGAHDPLLDDLTYAMNLPFGLAPAAVQVTRELQSLPPTLPAGDALLLGGGDGCEALAVAATGRFDKVLVVEHSPLAVRRNRQLATWLARWLANQGSETTIEAILGDAGQLNLPAAGTSVALAIHLLEYLSPQERQGLYAQLRRALKAGGRAVFAVHLAEGPRFAASARYGNVLKEETPDGVQLILTRAVPAALGAVQVQTFFKSGPFNEELRAAFPAADYDFVFTTAKTAAGFVEASAVLKKK